MTAAMAILVCAFGAVLGWIACRFEQGAVAERATERLHPHGPPRSHCHLVTPPFDQKVAP